MKQKTIPKAPDLPYEAKVWRYALLQAAHDVEQAIIKPSPRAPKEKLMHYVARTQAPLTDALARWTRANDEMHKAIDAAKEAPSAPIRRVS
jgi:hypothetical protein